MGEEKVEYGDDEIERFICELCETYQTIPQRQWSFYVPPDPKEKSFQLRRCDKINELTDANHGACSCFQPARFMRCPFTNQRIHTMVCLNRHFRRNDKDCEGCFKGEVVIGMNRGRKKPVRSKLIKRRKHDS